MKKNVAIIGCGHLGRRHIEGLGVSNSEINVHVYDVSELSINTCKTFVEDISDTIHNLEVQFYDSITDVGNAVICFDLVIISTTANQRVALLKKIFELIKSRAWLLEKPICQSPDELYMMIELTKGINIWVNHSRRIVPFYKDINAKFFNGQKLSISFESMDIGIACNISHLVDLVNFLTDELPVRIDTSGLLDQWHDSKRKGFKEINGTLVGEFSSGSKMYVRSGKNLNSFSISGEFINTGKHFIIDENKGQFILDEKIIQLEKIPYQSRLTGKVFDQISLYSKSDLTSFQVAADCYKPVIEALVAHWQSTTGLIEDKIIPIT